MERGGVERGGVTQYSPGVLVGNWQEQSRLRELELQDYQTRKATLCASSRATGSSRQASMAAASLLTSAASAIEERDALVARRLAEPTRLCTLRGDGLVRFGAPVAVVNAAHGVALALDLAQSACPGPHKAALTGSPFTAPQVRSTWVLEPSRDENNAAYRARAASHDVLHYGQHVRLANETASEEGFYYVHAEREAGLHSSLEQRAMASLGAGADNVFVVCKPGARREAVDMVGEPVSLGSPVLLLHALTNRPLCVAGTRVKTGGYGMEFAVTCDYANGGSFTYTRTGIAVGPENIFCFTVGEEESGPVMRKSRAASTLADTMPVPCGDGVEALLCAIREAALQRGGRLGFRGISLALGVAGSEHRRTYLTRPQLHRFLQEKLNLDLTPLELDAVVKHFDKHGQNLICAQELMAELRGRMSAERTAAAVLAHNQLIMEGEGNAEFVNMFNLYRVNAGNHPDVRDKLVSREQLILDFEKCWPGRVGTKIGTVTRDEFVEYYNDISPTVPDDERFMDMLQRCWAVPATADYMRGVPSRHIVVTHTNDTTETLPIPDTLVLDPNDRAAMERLLVRHGVRDVKDFSLSCR